MNSINSTAQKKKLKASSSVASSVPSTSRNPAVDHVSLSGRQQEIVVLLTHGKSNKEIADYLKIGYGKVKQHLFVLFRKLGVSNRTKAVITANQLMKEYSNDFVLNAKSVTQKSKVSSSALRWTLLALGVSSSDFHT